MCNLFENYSNVYLNKVGSIAHREIPLIYINLLILHIVYFLLFENKYFINKCLLKIMFIINVLLFCCLAQIPEK